METIRAHLNGTPVKDEPVVAEKENEVGEKKAKPSVAEVILKTTGVNILLCPKCGQCGLRLIRHFVNGSG